MSDTNQIASSKPHRLNLKWKFGITITLVIILISSVLFPIIYSQYKYQRLTELKVNALNVVKTVISINDPLQSRQQFINAITKVKPTTDLLGLVVFDNNDHIIAQYGETIHLTPQLMQNLTLVKMPLLIEKHNQFYAYWTNDLLKKPYAIIVKINGANYIRAMSTFIDEYIIITILTVIVLITISLFLSRFADTEYKSMALFPSENQNPIIRITADGKLRYANLGSLAILDKWQVNIGDLVPNEWRKIVSDALQLAEEKNIEEQFADKTYLINIAPIHDMNYVNLYFTDISKLKEYQQQLRKMTSYDQATNLPNRRLFIELLTQEMYHVRYTGQYLLVFYFGISDFKNISLDIGHDKTESLLLSLAKRLKKNLTRLHIIAHINQGNFAAVSKLIDNPEHANTIVQNIIEAFYKPFKINHKIIKLSTNIGIAIYPDDGNAASVLLKHADLAMYHARAISNNSYQFYTAEMNKRVQRQTKLIAELHEAIDKQQFELYFQPQHNFNDNKLIGAEVLLRWQHPEYGLVTPEVFINTLEETGMINDVCQWVLTSVCEQVAAWQKKGLTDIRFAVNISPKQFNEQKIIAHTKNLIAKRAIDPKLLEYEITEGITFGDAELAIKIMNQLHDLGIQIALDDFGTGYSSLKYLHKFPINRLKLDKSFIQGFGENGYYQSFIKTIISLGHILGMKVIAEGIETKAQYEFLKLNGCDEAQGYYLARPLNKEAFFEYASQMEIAS